MATLAHVLQLVGGFIAPLIIFFLRRESRFVSFHALQVLFLQIANLLFSMVFMVTWFAMMFGSIAATAGQPRGGGPPVMLFLVFPLLWLFIMASWVTILTLAIVYGIKAGRGEWANYPVLGKWARQVLHI
ncbi:MAG TPA: DUF4870 domain-containing protein [Terriglobales bacterium]|nr:DUF4870 domain-containing protein [Terriglobales bacterium]